MASDSNPGDEPPPWFGPGYPTAENLELLWSLESPRSNFDFFAPFEHSFMNPDWVHATDRITPSPETQVATQRPPDGAAYWDPPDPLEHDDNERAPPKTWNPFPPGPLPPPRYLPPETHSIPPIPPIIPPLSGYNTDSRNVSSLSINLPPIDMVRLPSIEEEPADILPTIYENSLVEKASLPACREPSADSPPSSGPIMHQTYPATVQQSDSGYGTISVGGSFEHQLANKLSIVEEGDAIQRSPSGVIMESIIENDEADNVTIFSDSGSLASREGLLATKLAEKLRSDLKIHAGDIDSFRDLEAVLPAIFKNFALEMAQSSNNQFGRDAMFYVYKNNEHLMHSLLQWTMDNPDDEDETEIHRSRELMEEQAARAKAWVSGTLAVCGDPNQTDPMDVCSPTSDQDDMESDPLEHDYATYANALDNSGAYQWLLATIRCEIALSPSIPDHRAMLRRTIAEKLPHPRVSRHRQPQHCDISVESSWNPWKFFRHQQYLAKPEEVAEKVIVVVGSGTNAQATTCLDYMMQTWPMSARSTMDCLLGLLQKGCNSIQTVARDDNSVVSMTYHDGVFVGRSQGTRAFVLEISEQLVWLENALRLPGPTTHNVWLTCARLFYVDSQETKQPPDASVSSPIRLRFKSVCEMQAVEAPRYPECGQCWHDLFHDITIVEGYPIPRRAAEELGLEISLELMAGLAQAQYLNIFRGVPVVKGFSTILYPTRQTSDSTTWHMRCNEYGNHISFEEGVSCYTPQIDISIISSGRHLLGWCKNAEIYAGAVDAAYPVHASMLPETHDDCALQGATVHQGTLIPLGSFHVGLKDVPVRLGRFESDPYSKNLQWLQKQSVVLWDEDDKRGWLVNGVSALLHLLRDCIVTINESDFGLDFMLDVESLKQGTQTHTARAAVEVLMNEDNKNLQLFRHEPERLKDQIALYFNLLEQMIAYQSFGQKQCGIVPGTEMSRRYLEGWDFSELAEGQDPIASRFAEVPTVGRAWIDLVRSTGAVVLLGRGFGDIIRPADRTSCLWAKVPADSYLLTSLVRDLQGLGQIRCPRSGKLTTRVGARFDLHNPSKLFSACRCDSEDAIEEHDSYVQVMLPIGSSEQLMLREPLGRPINHPGAIILGHNPAFSWVWKDNGPPELGDPLVFREPDARATPYSDSGYSSQAASSNSSCPAEPQIGIICALPKELKAVWALLDCVDQQGDDDNPYLFGHLGGYTVVAACLPYGEYGTNAAAAAAANLARSHPQLEFTLLIGIGGGIPSDKHDIRLGDVVVGLSSNPQELGIIQYDAGKIHQDGFELKRSSLQPPPMHVKKIVATMEADPNPPEYPLEEYLQKIIQKCPGYASPGPGSDVLYHAQPDNPFDCGKYPGRCDCEPLTRTPRKSSYPKIHYGPIASGNSVVKDAATRDELAKRYNAICVEMEAAGIANELQCVVIRGICDYADSHKNKAWQEYAAATAAAYAKYLLTQIRRSCSVKRKRKRAMSSVSSEERRRR